MKKLSRFYRFLIISAVIILVITILAIIKITPFALYQNKALGFKIKYPEYWKVVEKPQGVDAIIFVSPPENASDLYWENVNVTTKPVAANLRSINAFSDAIIRQLTTVFEGNIEILQSRPMSIAGRQGHVLIFCGTNVQEPVQYLHAWVISGTKAYIITYTSLRKDFNNYFNDVMAMIKSFRII